MDQVIASCLLYSSLDFYVVIVSNYTNPNVSFSMKSTPNNYSDFQCFLKCNLTGIEIEVVKIRVIIYSRATGEKFHLI